MPIWTAYLYGLLTLVSLELGALNPDWFWLALGATLFLNIFFVWLAGRGKLDKSFGNFLISPFLFLLSGFLFLGFTDKLIAGHLAIAFMVIGSAAFVRQLIILAYHKYQYKNHALSTISRLLNTTTIFFWFGGMFDLYIFLKIPFSLILMLNILVVYLLTYQFFIINKIKTGSSRWFIPVITLVVTELFLGVSWLPVLSAVKALVMTSIYYFFTGIAQHFILGTLNRKTYWRYGAMTIFIGLIVLATARWN